MIEQSEGKPAIFRPKDGKPVRAGALTALGTRLFDAARSELKKLSKWPRRVSDGDVIDYLVRGKKLK